MSSQPHLVFRPLLAIVLALAIALSCTTAFADPVDVDALIGAAVDDFKAKRFEEAAAKFLQARRLIDDPNLDWNIARSFEETGDCANAKVWFTRVKSRKARKGDDRKTVKKNAKRARSKLKGLRGCPQSAPVEFTCADENVEISIDDRSPFTCPVTLHLVAGDHELLAKLPGGGEERRLLTVKEGVDVDVSFGSLAVEKPPAEAVPPPQEHVVAPPPPEDDEPGWLGQRGGVFWGGVACLVAGLGGVGSSFYFQSQTDDAQADYDALVKEPTLDDAQRQKLLDLRDEGESKATLANIARFGGAGLAAAGVTLIVLDIVLADGDSETGSALLAPVPGGVVAGWTLVF